MSLKKVILTIFVPVAIWSILFALCAQKVCCPFFPFMEFSSRYVIPSCLDFNKLYFASHFKIPNELQESNWEKNESIDQGWFLSSAIYPCVMSLQYTLMQRLFLDLSFLSIAFMIHCLSNDAASKTPTLTSIIAAWREAS